MSEKKQYTKRDWLIAGAGLALVGLVAVYFMLPPFINGDSQYIFERQASEPEKQCLNKVWSGMGYPKSIWVYDSVVENQTVTINYAMTNPHGFYRDDQAQCLMDGNEVSHIQIESLKLTPEEMARKTISDAKWECQKVSQSMAAYPDTVKFIDTAAGSVDDTTIVELYWTAKNKLSQDVRNKSSCAVRDGKVVSYYLDGKKVI
ncbi:hypothetical protein [Endozoicomonas sp. Mp262]|uniref:hypothetical protein n=1 Tax=Endozoicomonas sp. Mp262 TaxID=2919499 RepID=UPI0021D8BF4C